MTAAWTIGSPKRSCDEHAMRQLEVRLRCIGHCPVPCEAGQQAWETAALWRRDSRSVRAQHPERGVSDSAAIWSTARASAQPRRCRTPRVMDGGDMVGKTYDARKHLRGP